MKIYFIGSTSVGKSTLARYISEKYKLPLIPEVARQILAEKELQLDSLRTNLSLVNDYQTEIFFRQILEESKYQTFVSDRSFDCLAYAAQYSQILSKLSQSKELNSYLEKLRDPNVFLFFVRPSKATLKADGVRESFTWESIISIDAMVKFMLELWSLRYFQINTDIMQERISLIESILSVHKS